jgi:hypothetical protein
MAKHTRPCERCVGTGLVPRPVSPLAEDDYVRRYLGGMPWAGTETCDRCGGSGVEEYVPNPQG